MMQNPGHTARDTATVAQAIAAFLIALTAAPATAQVDTSEWRCEFCPFESGYRATYEAGADFVGEESVRFGNSSGYDQSGGYVALGGEGRYRADNYQAGWRAEDLGLDSRSIELQAGSQGSYGLHLGYSELPYRLFGTTSTVYSAVSPDVLTLPADWVTSTDTSGFTNLPTSLRPQDIASDRRRLTAGAEFLAARNFTLHADYRREERDGIDIVSGANFTQASLLPRLLDFETDLIDIGVGYANGPFSVSVGWFGSFFKNNLGSLTWDNAFTSPPGQEQRRLAQEPDNEFQQVSVSGSYRATLFDSVIAFSAALGQGEQDETLLPYTINPAIAAGPLPQATLDGKVDTHNYSLSLTTRPVDKARIKLAYRYDERDNQTAQSQWSRVIVDSIASGAFETNIPYSFERGRFTASGSYQLFDNLRLSAGFDRKETDRDFQEVAEQTENSGWARAKWRPLDWLAINLKGGTSRRDIDRYDESVANSFGQNPLLRKYNLAYRYRESAEITVSATPADWPVSTTIWAMFADDSYSQSQLGITEARNSHVSVDLNWAVNDDMSLYFTVGSESIDADQLGSDSFSTADWTAFHRDSFEHFGGGLTLRNIWDRTALSIDYYRTRGDADIRIARSGMSASDFPEIDTDLESLRLSLRYQRSERLEIDLSFRYESFVTNDWALAGVEADTIPTVLTLGADPYDYGVWVFGASFRYLIGGR